MVRQKMEKSQHSVEKKENWNLKERYRGSYLQKLSAWKKVDSLDFNLKMCAP